MVVEMPAISDRQIIAPTQKIFQIKNCNITKLIVQQIPTQEWTIYKFIVEININKKFNEMFKMCVDLLFRETLSRFHASSNRFDINDSNKEQTLLKTYKNIT
ncbi:hypothetical protein DPMN_133323 [Dreissena polymorpha]|uniref:Uncharacterized protein n=1 Tax=Dreissena polymorpha TaxID=45954 RepID=A0A9D4FU20_DREPO|nr:hypothetical protein DPMN_133323 [Dreissena polymorpha]